MRNGKEQLRGAEQRSKTRISIDKLAVQHERRKKEYDYLAEKEYGEKATELLDGKFKIRVGDKVYDLYTFISLLDKVISKGRRMKALDIAMDFYDVLASDLIVLKNAIPQIVKDIEKKYVGAEAALDKALEIVRRLEMENSALYEKYSELARNHEILKYKHSNRPSIQQDSAPIETGTKKEDFSEWDDIFLTLFKRRRDQRIRGEGVGKLYPTQLNRSIRNSIRFKMLENEDKKEYALAMMRESYERVRDKLIDLGELKKESDYD